MEVLRCRGIWKVRDLEGGEWAGMAEFSTEYVSKDLAQNYFIQFIRREEILPLENFVCYKGFLMYSIHFNECSLLIWHGAKCW